MAWNRPEYGIWWQIVNRCEDPEHRYYADYGGRGISVCQRWRDSFEAFLEDVGPRPSCEHSIERIDNDGNYEPGNVRWATRKEQARNKRNNRLLTFRGETRCLAAWAELLKMQPHTLWNRLRLGWSVAKALTTPLQAQRPKTRPRMFRGETRPLAEWARRFGLNIKTVEDRLRRGWPLERALTSPVEGGSRT